MSKPADSAGSVVPSEVRELIEESRTIQGWIDRLSSHADEARPEVFERVRADYSSRLGGVTGKLARYRSDLVERLESRQSEVTSLRDDRDSHAAELEEARLRHAVGEFSDARWEDRRGSIEESLGELDALLEIEESAVAELSGIISSIGEAGTPAVDVAPAPEIVVEGLDVGAVEEEMEPEPVEAVAEAVEDAGAEAEEADAEGELVASLGDEPAEASDDFVEDVEAEEEEAPVAASEAPAQPVTLVDAEDDEAGGEYLDELEFLESLSLDEADRFDAVSAMLDEEEQQPES